MTGNNITHYKMKEKMISIDGSYLSGGGQMLRTALALSIITKKPFNMFNIRANRPNPGLKNQHLYSIKALISLSNSKATGVFSSSKEISFFPGEFNGGKLSIDIKTAGSITLVMQALMLPMIFLKKTKVRITGGTDVKWSPTIDYFKNVLCYYYRKYADVDVRILKRGYYPKGGGIVEISTEPYNIKNKKPLLLIDRNTDYSQYSIVGVSHASQDLMDKEVAERQANESSIIIKEKLGIKPYIHINYMKTESPGSGICLWASYPKYPKSAENNENVVSGSDALGSIDLKAEEVGRRAANHLIEEIELGVVDSLLADQLVPLVGLVGGKIKTSRITEHTKTNVYITNLFLDNILSIKNNTIENTKTN